MADSAATSQAPDSASPVKKEASVLGRLSPTKDKKEHFPHSDPGPFKAHFLALSSKRKDEWQVRIAAMQGIKVLLDDGTDKGNAAFYATFRPGVQPLLEQLNDVKPKVPLVACEVLTSLSNVTGKAKEFEGVFVDYVIPSLLNHVYTKSNPALATASQSVMVAIISGSVFPRALDRLIASATSKIAELKQRSLELIILAMQKWPAVAFSRHASKLGAVITDAVQVGSIETRDIGRKAMTQFHALFPDEAAKHLSAVDEHTLKQLESVMPGAKASAAAAAVAREPSASFAPPKPKPKPKPKAQDSESAAPAAAAIATDDGAAVASADIPGNSTGEMAIKLQKCEAALKSERAGKKRQQEQITMLEDKIRTLETEAKSKDAAKDEGQKEDAGALVKARGEAVTAKKRAATLEKRVLELQGVVDKQEALLNTVNKRLEEMAGIVESRAALAKECEETKSKLEELDSEYVGAQQRWKEREREWFDKRTQLEEQLVELETQIEAARLENLKLQGEGRSESRQSNHASFDVSSSVHPPSRGRIAAGAGGRDSVESKRQGADAAEWAQEQSEQLGTSPKVPAPVALKPRPPTGPTRMQSPRAGSAFGQQQLQQALTELEDVRAQLVVLSEEAAETTRQLSQQQTDKARLEIGLDRLKQEMEWRARMAAQEVQKLRHEKSESEMRAQRAEAIGSALLLDLRNGTKDTQLARDYAEGLLTRIESIIHDENGRYKLELIIQHRHRMKELAEVKSSVLQLHKGAEKRLEAFIQAEHREWDQMLGSPSPKKMIGNGHLPDIHNKDGSPKKGADAKKAAQPAAKKPKQAK